jgi:xanthine/CO dehydrogenase XdhC/CoxF family maturation factor
MEVLLPPVQLIIFGGGYDVAPVVKAASALGWEVTVTDDCVAHVGPKRFPEASCVVHIPRDNVTQGIHYSDRCAALLMSHNYRYDLAILRQLVSTPLSYIGILGPRKRGEKLMAELSPNEREALQERSYYPVGLDIGAETPEEIALSALAEIMAVFNHRQGAMLRHRQTPIHERG